MHKHKGWKEMKVYNEYKNQENKYVYIEIEVTNERKILVGFKFLIQID